MISLVLILAAQAASSAEDRERAMRRQLASDGLSVTGVEAQLAVRKRREAEANAALVRVQKADRALRVAAAKRPVDVDAVAAALIENNAALAQVMQVRTTVMVEQLRASPPADRAIMLRQYEARPPGAPLPIAPPAPR